MEAAKTYDDFLKNIPDQWKTGVNKLRAIFLAFKLEEEIKWGIPNYTLNKKLIAGIGAFKSYFGIWFHQGVFLEDKQKVLINAQRGKTKGMRQWRMYGPDIDEELVRSYIEEAIQNQKDGKEILPDKNPKSVEMPPELTEQLNSGSKLQEAFSKLSPYKQREYCEYIDEAKRTQTRINRLNKSIPLILQGKGLHDKYR